MATQDLPKVTIISKRNCDKSMPDHSPITFEKKNSAYLYLLFFSCFGGGLCGGISSTLLSSYLPAVIADLAANDSLQKRETIAAVINSAFLFGMMFGGITLGFFGDRYGRKVSVQAALLFIGIFTILTGVAQNWYNIFIYRLLSGFGTGGVLVTTTILLAETWTEKKRDIALGILSVCFPLGIFSAGLITFGISNWRTGFLAGILPLILFAVNHFSIMESHQWKSGKEKNVDARKPFIHSVNRGDLLSGCLVYGTMLIGLWSVFAWLPSWVQTQVTGSDGQKERGVSMMLFAVGGISGGILSGWLTKWLGIKKILGLCFASAFILCFVLFELNKSLSVYSYLEMGLLALFFGISQGALNFYIPALFPTRVRSTATGFCFNTGRIFTASAVFFVGWLVQWLGGYGKALFIFSFVFLAGWIVIIATKERSPELDNQ